MEYKLNKIDVDIRKKIDEERKSNKIHSRKAINVNKDLNEEKLKSSVNDRDDDKNKKKKFIIIDGIKCNKEEINIKAEKKVEINVNSSVGGIIDIKK